MIKVTATDTAGKSASDTFDVIVPKPPVLATQTASQTFVAGKAGSFALAATTFSGLYGFARQMLAYRGILERMQKGLSSNRRMRIRAGEDMPLDLIPVDAVAAQPDEAGLLALLNAQS